MAPILKKGLFCCLSLRTCALILGTITLAFNLLTLSMFIVSLDMWLSESEYHHWNHTADHLDGHLLDVHGVHDVHQDGLLPMPGLVNKSAWWPGHPEGHPGHAGAALGAAEEEEPEEYDGFEDSEAMEELLERNPHLALALVWFDFVLVILETVAVVLLIWGAAKRRAVLLLPWLGVELFTTLYDLGFFVYMFISNDVYIAIDLMPILLLPLTVYCWLVVYSLYQECKETAAMNTSMPLSMSALEAATVGGTLSGTLSGALGGNVGQCTVPYGRMA
ncbi:uncharacterized protein LOC117652992 [Thrips palmi]|uniref:Uncharacterized protein LOC117652992 n=1 Tax=Thrips palmi TaxID=161013 RepID=A0A6P9AA32_THRPL|nr:uncharacterized protein LOC117652992 [Thrips palmi]XP_034254198.1 uncharacterized protein LOC117652992 [Thrips palmi]XP_034254199.1 uncharacterized protein LOC117652992 [Thrips palmi]XP_034254201.1 uncharacterized protein LOC117652992 [Thrips palmi]